MVFCSAVLVLAVLSVSVPDITEAECVNHPTDVIFLLDASTNSQSEFRKMLDLAINVTGQLHVDDYDYKVGMMIFSRSYRSVFYLSKYDDRDDIIKAINATDLHVLNRTVTDTGDALNYARRTMASTSYGHRHGADLVIITMVSSPSSNPSAVVNNAKLLKDSTGATMIAVGIGSKVPDAELAALSSDPAHLSRVPSFDDLASSNLQLLREICPNDWHTAIPQTGSTQTVYDCPETLIRDQYLQVFQGVCYQFNVFRTRSFSDATKDCARYGGTLVLIKNQETNFFIQNELYNTYHISAATWIGLVEKMESADGGKGHYVWADGSTANYTNFGDVVGHDHEKNCIAIVPQLTGNDAGRWREYHCDPNDADVDESSRLRFVCQYNIAASGATTPAGTPTLEPTDPTTAAPTHDTFVTSTTTAATSLPTGPTRRTKPPRTIAPLTTSTSRPAGTTVHTKPPTTIAPSASMPSSDSTPAVPTSQPAGTTPIVPTVV